MSDVTLLLTAIEQGNQQAAGELLPLVYEELRRMARAHMATERAEHTLQATALVHEAYMRLVGDVDPRWEGRGHFFAAAAEAMRRILVEHARTKHSLKRGGNLQRVGLEEFPPIVTPSVDLGELLDLDAAIERFTIEDAKKAELVKLVYFAGLTLSEAASVLGMSRTTAHRHWVYARAWLRDAVTGQANFAGEKDV